MEKQELLQQEEQAYLKYHQFKLDGKKLKASIWYKKFEKISKARKLAEALIKRELKANGITRLNTVKI